LPIAGVGTVLERLQIPSCVASSSDLDRVSFSLSLTGLAPHFDGRLYTAEMVERASPPPISSSMPPPPCRRIRVARS